VGGPATAQTQAEATKQAQRAGIAHAKASGDGYRGRKLSYTRAQFQTVRDMLAQSAGISQIATATESQQANGVPYPRRPGGVRGCAGYMGLVICGPSGPIT
jgi:hypothetical protein